MGRKQGENREKTVSKQREKIMLVLVIIIIISINMIIEFLNNSNYYLLRVSVVSLPLGPASPPIERPT